MLCSCVFEKKTLKREWAESSTNSLASFVHLFAGMIFGEAHFYFILEIKNLRTRNLTTPSTSNYKAF